MLPLIKRVRVLINDPSSATFDDQTVQDVLDESRLDIINEILTVKPTYTAGSVQFLNYYAKLGGWEDDVTFKQYLTIVVTPTFEPIVGHALFATSTFPPIMATGKVYDMYQAAADLLERMSAQYVLQFSFSTDGQSFHPEQIQANLASLVTQYRRKQRPGTISMARSDLSSSGQRVRLGPTDIDYIADGR